MAVNAEYRRPLALRFEYIGLDKGVDGKCSAPVTGEK